jgi:hypothetical protein
LLLKLLEAPCHVMSQHAMCDQASLDYFHVVVYLVGDTNDTASWASTSVTGLLGFLMAALAEVVGAGVDHNGAL